MNKILFVRHFQHKIPVRWHMTVICLITLAAGLLFSKAILFFNLAGIMFRYSSAVVFAYGIFFSAIYIWLLLYFDVKEDSCIEREKGATLREGFEGGPVYDAPCHTASLYDGGGGEFAGAGATSNWDASAPVATSVSKESVGATEMSVGSVEGGGDEIVIIFFFLALLTVIFGAAIYIIYLAPEILLEAAFEVLLVVGLFKQTKNIQAQGWAYSILKRTYLPFLLVLLMALVAGFTIKYYCPDATSFGQYRALCGGGNKP